MNIYIKNMISPRCIHFVKTEMEKLGIKYSDVKLGEATVPKKIDPCLFEKLEAALNELDLYIIQDKRSMLVDKIKQEIIELVQNKNDELPRENYSSYLGKKFDHNYTYLANIFSESEGITIEHFIIKHKIEIVKQLLLENELSLSQIADKLQYSSVAHLSSQFKKITGITASHFRQAKAKEQYSSHL